MAEVGPFRALDDELVKVGRACVSAKARLLAENIRHQFCRRRKCGMVVCYQAGETEVVTPTRYAASSANYVWRYRTGLNTRHVRVSALTMGATGPTPWVATDHPYLTFSTDIDSSNTADAHLEAAPTTTFSTDTYNRAFKILEITEDSVEDVTVTQGADVASTAVRIQCLALEEMPVSTVFPGTDTWALAETLTTPGTDIIDTEYDDIPIAMQTLRRYHKKVLWSLGKKIITDNTPQEDAVAGRDGGGGILRYDIYPSVNRPETSGVAVTCYVYAEDTVANNGQVRFVFGSGTINITNITTGGEAWYSATGTIAEGSDTLSFQLDQTAAGTLTVYQALVVETQEAA